MYKLSHIVLLLLFLKINYCKNSYGDDFFQADLGDQMTIGLSDQGYKNVALKCGSNSMTVTLETEEDFEGVIYTRGNFFDKDSECFLDPGFKAGQRNFTIKFAFEKCNTIKKDEVYSNILILQHDKELIMPGDAAFRLECDYRESREVTVNANLQKEKSIVSRITLTDADPSVKESSERDKRSTAENASDTVVLTSESLKSRKDEL